LKPGLLPQGKNTDKKIFENSHLEREEVAGGKNYTGWSFAVCEYTIVMVLHEIMNTSSFFASSINSAGISPLSVHCCHLMKNVYFKELIKT
jgi:hypothetical protein